MLVGGGLDPRTPVIVGVSVLNMHHRGSEPIAMMKIAAEEAVADTGAPGLADRIDAVRVVWGVWPYRDPGRLVAVLLGAPDARTTLTTPGGHQVYDVVADTAARIRDGELDVAVVCAAETLRTRRFDRTAGRHTEYHRERAEAAPDERFGDDRPLASDAEQRAGIDVPSHFYAMAETAIRHRTGEAPTAHRERIASMWASASTVAAGNPDGWLRREFSATEIATESADNRPIASPYPKLMTSNVDVDQGGAIVICSAAAADAAGVPRDQWVFPMAASAAADHWHPTNRWAFDESPAMRLVGTRALALAQTDVDGCALLDLYSCFPAVVQVAQRELAIDPARPFTITGGLTFAGGPLNCYCILPLVRAVRLLRWQPAERAFLSGNGGYFTKHSALVLSGEPPPRFCRESVQAEVDRLPARPTPNGQARIGTLETYTVVHDRDGAPARGILSLLDDGGARHFATTDDDTLIAELLSGDQCGRPIDLAESTLT